MGARAPITQRAPGSLSGKCVGTPTSARSSRARGRWSAAARTSGSRPSAATRRSSPTRTSNGCRSRCGHGAPATRATAGAARRSTSIPCATSSTAPPATTHCGCTARAARATTTTRAAIGSPTATPLPRRTATANGSTGAGFYEYEDGWRGRLWPGLTEAFGPPAESPPPLEELIERLLFAEALEATRAYGEGAIESAVDANVGSVLGIGFPRRTAGGALRGTLQAARLADRDGRSRRSVRRRRCTCPPRRLTRGRPAVTRSARATG